MDLEKAYCNLEGEKRTVLQMVKDNPEWAANRVQAGEEAIEQVKVLRDSDKVFRQVIEKLTADNHGMTPGWLLDLVP
ncbi:MAG: hypothetical protein Q7J12_00120 [Syntrophales bacterium]|uniref:hypothetical protein n=1 Tax=Candidatus Wunengus sp. YC61 TaxID=3367698 RepID=UPI00271CDE4C|nr:hypothetical protein [Syntrophales bacterium]